MATKLFDVALAEEHKRYVTGPGAAAALDLMIRESSRITGLSFYPAWHGKIREFRYDDIASDEQPFAFIVNRKHLLFYIRRPALGRPMTAASAIRKRFPYATETKQGEWTVRISDRAMAERVCAWLHEYRGAAPPAT